MVFLTSCSPATTKLARPEVEIPVRPNMLPVQWQHDGTMHCLTDDEARKLLINISRKDAHIEVLEGYLRAVMPPSEPSPTP
jgi:hypothetical protein